jgi:hypothetical protein
VSDVPCYGKAPCQHTGAPNDEESRRWCHDCTEWCYPGDPEMLCVRGLEYHLRAERDELLPIIEALREADWDEAVGSIKVDVPKDGYPRQYLVAYLAALTTEGASDGV